MQKISFTTLSTPGLDVAAVAALARRFGYDGADLRFSAHAGELLPDATEADAQAVGRIFADEGVELAGLMCYLDFSAADGLARSLAGQVGRMLDLAAASGAQSIRLIGSDREGTVEALAQALGDVLACRGEPIDVVLQNHLNAFTAAQCLQVIELAGDARVSLAFSPDHCVLMGEGFGGILPRIAGHVRKLFVADVQMVGPAYETVLPGQGIVPLADSYDAAGGPGFDGWITFKYEQLWVPSLLGPEEALPYFIERAPQWFPGWHRRK